MDAEKDAWREDLQFIAEDQHERTLRARDGAGGQWEVQEEMPEY